MKALAPMIAIAGTLAFAASAQAESIVYVNAGDLWLTNIERSIQLTNDGGYESPSQDNAGRIVAVRRVEEGEYTNRYIHRFDARGNQLNPRVTAVDVNNSLKTGPLGAEVSADGTFVAYHHFNRSPSIPENQRPRFSISYASRDTPPEEIVDAGYYLNPTWIDNDRVAIFSDPAFTGDVQIYTLSGGGSFSEWFEFEPGDLTSGDLAQTGTRFAAVADGGARLVFFSLEAPPPAPPTPRCEASTPNGQYGSVTWSPDGTAVAWAEADGIHLASVGDLAACDIREVAVIPGGESPFWGNATLPAAPVVCEAKIPSKVTRRKALRAIKVRIACPGAAKATGKGRVGRKVVASGSQALSEGEGTLRIKAKRDGKPLIREANNMRVIVNVGGKRFARKVKIGG